MNLKPTRSNSLDSAMEKTSKTKKGVRWANRPEQRLDNPTPEARPTKPSYPRLLVTAVRNRNVAPAKWETARKTFVKDAEQTMRDLEVAYRERALLRDAWDRASKKQRKLLADRLREVDDLHRALSLKFTHTMDVLEVMDAYDRHNRRGGIGAV